jgi:hypothetical protein
MSMMDHPITMRRLGVEHPITMRMIMVSNHPMTLLNTDHRGVENNKLRC